LLILLTLLGISALSVAKGAYRLAAVLLVMPEHAGQLQRTWWSPTLQAALAPFLMALSFLLSAGSRRMQWRGVRYELRSPWETRVLGTTGKNG
jgi:hypothetical protein